MSESSNNENNGVKKEKKELLMISDYSKHKETITDYIGVGIWLGWFAFYGYAFIWMPILYYTAPYLLYLILTGLFISAISPLKEKKQPKWTRFVGKLMMRSAQRYFKLRIFLEDKEALDKATHSVFTIEPHDVLPLSICGFSQYLGHFPNHDLHGCLTKVIFQTPGLRHIYSWCSSNDVGKKAMRRILSNNQCPCLCPGGVQEVAAMATAEENEVVLYIKSRAGHIRLAAEYGVPVVPCFAFGQRAIYDSYIPKGDLVTYIGRKIGFIPILFKGLFGIPFFIPKPEPLVLIVGTPIEIPKKDNMTREEAQSYLDQWVEANRRLFEDNKERFGMGGHKLTIL